MPQIVSASRRTDIPAFYFPWFLNRLAEGFVLVPNPYHPRQVSRVSLRPEDVTAIVFWTKNPAAMMCHLGTLENLGLRFFFQYTLNHYPAALEPGLPPLEQRVACFRELSGRIGPARVVWRYDPIVLSNRTDTDYHRAVFRRLCERLGAYTRRVVVSLVDTYKKTRRNLARLEGQGYRFVEEAAGQPQTEAFLADLADTAREFSLEISTCAERRDYSHLGLRPGACIDGRLIEHLWGVRRRWRKDPGQRERCLCVVSRDIGVFDTCMHGCPYCYANQDSERVRRRYRRHDPASPVLVDEPGDLDPW